MESLTNDIKNMLTAFQKSMKGYFPVVEQEVNRIIICKSRDENKIEHLLDTLHSCILSGMNEGFFSKLVDYYRTVNSEAAEWYWNEYKKWDDEDY